MATARFRHIGYNLGPFAARALRQSAVRDPEGRFPFANPRIFGSMLHDTDTEDSDLNLLVDALPGTPLFDLGLLEDLLGVSVRLLISGDLSPGIRNRILAEAIPI